MSDLFATAENFKSGDGPLHRLDPRLKLLLLLLVVVTIFSARNFAVLFFVGLLATGLLIWQPVTLRHFLRRLPYLRWLLIFTLLLHLFLTPGRTLFGLRMLSYDGLLRGVMVDLQLLLALFFTLCFALFTAPQAVAWGAARLLSPLQRLGLPVSEAGGLLVLVLHFLPQVFQQGAPLVQQVKQQRTLGFTERLQQLSRLVGDAILNLVGQADQLAHEICRGECPLLQGQGEFCWQRVDTLCLILVLPFILVCWSL
jgi:energy-coupling factor transport system permease protein